MRVLRGICLMLCVTGTVAAQTQTVDFETGYAPGAVVGQQGWSVQTGDAGAPSFVIDQTNYSPMGGSTQSLKLGGPTGLTRVQRNLDTNVTGGVWRVGYDFRYTGQVAGSTTSMIMTTTFYDDVTPIGGSKQIVQPYAQDSDGGASGGAAQNGFTCTAPLGGYGGANLVPGGVYNPNQWYRFEFTMDFNQGLIVDLAIYDISSGSKVQTANNPGTFYFQSVGGAYYQAMTRWGVRFDAANPAEAWWIDNFSITPATLPAPQLGAPPLWANANVPFSKSVPLVTPQPVTWELLAGPAGAVIDPTTGVISGWTPTTAGTTADFTVKATNMYSDSATKSFTVTVVGQYDVASISFDAQIDAGAGPAITPNVAPNYWEFGLTDGSTSDPFGRFHVAGGGWYNSFVSFGKAGFGAFVDLSSCYTRMSLDVRYFQVGGYGDAPVVARFYDTANKVRTWWFHRDTNDLHYPVWQSHLFYLNNQAVSPWDTGWSDSAFDPSKVTRLELFGTDWSGTGSDYIDVNNLLITTQPVAPVIAEIVPDPDSAVAGFPYSRQLSATGCYPVWAVVSGPSGLTVDSNGLVSGWTPVAGQGTVTITVSCTNDGGSDTKSWQVVVITPPVLDGSNVAEPWGILHGNLSATQSSAAPSMVFSDQWANGATVAWTLNMAGASLTGVGERGTITFDEAGNLYFVDDAGTMASVAPDGTVRWTATGFAGGDTTTVVVGDGGENGRAYAATSTGIAAVKKSDGTPVWSRTLPGCGFDSGNPRLTPVLYQGLLCVVGFGNLTKNVYAVNANNGDLIFTRSIAVNLENDWTKDNGSMTFVPEAFGAGVHGLYFNADGNGSGTDAYAIRIDMNSYSASLAWVADGGKVARSHIPYSSTTGRLYTPTWTDDGAPFYSFDALTGAMQSSSNGVNAGHGWNDFCALDFNGTDVISAAGGGYFIRYQDNGDGTATATTYKTNPSDLIDYGEERMYGGLYPNAAGHSILVYGTRSNIGNELVTAFDATTAPFETCASRDDTPMYVDNFKVTYGATGVETVHVDAAGFEGYALGNLPGQTNSGGTGSIAWQDDTGGGASGVGQVQVVNNLPVGGSGKGLMIDATGGCGGWQGAFADFADLTAANGKVIVSWDQYRGDLTDNLWVAEDISYGGWWAMAWDSSSPVGGLTAQGGSWDSPFVPLTVGVWQHIEYQFNLSTGDITLKVDSNTVSETGTGVTSLRGFDWEIEGTAAEGSDYVPPTVTPIFTYPTGLNGEGESYIRGLQMGPVTAGRTQQVYFFQGKDALVALTYIRPIPGDANGDRDVDSEDYSAFVACLNAGNGPTLPATGAGCEIFKLDGDNDIDSDDFGLFQRCYTGAGIEGSPDCTGLP